MADGLIHPIPTAHRQGVGVDLTSAICHKPAHQIGNLPSAQARMIPNEPGTEDHSIERVVSTLYQSTSAVPATFSRFQTAKKAPSDKAPRSID